MNTDGIVLLSKQAGLTSFSSLNSIKKALNTTKVGHTGTLDSFAQGLLVVCTGRLTRLAGNITEFNKSYKAIIKFGSETDTLEYTGKIIKEAPLPNLDTLKKTVEAYTGNLMQQPPTFSAIHIDGKRASDLARRGNAAEIPERPVTIFKSEIIETKLNNENKVEYALIDFKVSKGTYIRSLARDIGCACGSAGHLIGLYRTQVGNFNIEDAAGFNDLPQFNIESAIQTMKDQLEIKKNITLGIKEKIKYIPDDKEIALQEEIKNKLKSFDEQTAMLCGFGVIRLVSENAIADFKNGKPLISKNFNINLHTLSSNSIISVFDTADNFTGLIEKDQNGRVHYKFVIN